jgi:hypothetical protein
VFGDHSNHEPIAFGEHLKAANVFHELAPVVAVLVTVVLDADPQLLPTHIDEGSEVSVGDPDLRCRPRNAGVDHRAETLQVPARRIRQLPAVICPKPKQKFGLHRHEASQFGDPVNLGVAQDHCVF